jgi:hemolysin III
MSAPVFALVVLGGLIYSIGTLFYLMERLPFHNTLWHVFVLAASAVYYAAVTAHVMQTAA